MFRVTGAGEIVMPPSQRRHLLERASGALPILEIGIGRPNGLLEMQIVFPDDNEAIWLTVRKGRYYNSIDDAEHGGVGTDAEGESQDSDGREAGGFSQQPKRVTQILPERLHGHSIIYYLPGLSTEMVMSWKSRVRTVLRKSSRPTVASKRPSGS